MKTSDVNCIEDINTVSLLQINEIVSAISNGKTLNDFYLSKLIININGKMFVEYVRETLYNI